ncbi:hypothetical protein PLESTF_000471600 [Pleodorina starrii]|nr:hypothetical protein PLESTM_001767500 [Pleodorina starrii]GLC66760.1 hypothetical protein PLESTF_000471600 [Pleodorina starrii]
MRERGWRGRDIVWSRNRCPRVSFSWVLESTNLLHLFAASASRSATRLRKAGGAASGMSTTLCLRHISEGCAQGLRQLLVDRCGILNDPHRASQLVEDTHVKKRIYIAAPDRHRLARRNEEALEASPTPEWNEDNLSGEVAAVDDTPKLVRLGDLAGLAAAAKVLVIYSVWPGRSSYSVFVEGQPAEDDAGGWQPDDNGAGAGFFATGGGLRSGRDPTVAGATAGDGTAPLQQPANRPNQPNEHDDNGHNHHSHLNHHLDHQIWLFTAAVRAILELPHPPGPARLAFSAIPAHAAPHVLRVLREAGYDRLWDEPCYRYWTRSLPPPPPPPPPPPALPNDSNDVADGGAEEGEPQYVLDTLRSEADVRLVESLWSYRSQYSLPLVRLLVAHRPSACVRLKMPPPLSSPPPPSQPQPQQQPSPPSPPPPPPSDGGGVQSAHGALLPAAGPVSVQHGSGSGFGSGSGSGSSDAVAWILQYADGSLGMAHTLAPHRRKGLMRRCAADLTRQVLRRQRQRQGGAEMAEMAGEKVGVGGGCSTDGDDGGGGGGGACPSISISSSSGGAAAGDTGRDAVPSAGQRLPAGQRKPEAFTYIVAGNAASMALFEGLGFVRDPLVYHWLGVEGAMEAAEDVQAAQKEQRQQQQK